MTITENSPINKVIPVQQGERFSQMSIAKKLAYGAGICAMEFLSLSASLTFLAAGVTAATAAIFVAGASLCFCNTAKAKNWADYSVGFLNEGLALALCPLLYWIPVTWFDPIAKDISPEHKKNTPVLLVHGYLHNSSCWHIFKKELLKDNPDRLVFTIDLGAMPFNKSIDGTYQDRMAEKIAEIKSLTGSNSIHLVGHSMGGMVSAVYACNEAEKEDGVKVESVVTIGSPLEGTPVGQIAFEPLAKAMRTDSPLVSGTYHTFELGKYTVRTYVKESMGDRIGNIRDHVNFFHFGTTSDEFVPHPDSTICAKAKKKADPKSYKIVIQQAHVSMVFAPEVIKGTIAHINETKKAPDVI